MIGLFFEGGEPDDFLAYLRCLLTKPIILGSRKFIPFKNASITVAECKKNGKPLDSFLSSSDQKVNCGVRLCLRATRLIILRTVMTESLPMKRAMAVSPLPMHPQAFLAAVKASNAQSGNTLSLYFHGCSLSLFS